MDDDMNDFTLHILNEKNKVINKDFIEAVLEKYGLKHKVKYLENFQRAMIHVSYLKKTVLADKTAKLIKDVVPIDDPSKAMPLQDKSYERLEFLGDSVIHHAIARYLFDRYENEDEGFLTKLRTKLENKKNLAYISRKLNFNEYAIFARNIELTGGRMSNISIMEDIFEAFVGALSLETNFENCKKFIINIMEREIDIAELIHTENNYKEMMMQYCHKMKWSDPIYATEEVMEEGTRRKFRMNVKANGNIAGSGIGITKKEGEQNAARMALISYGVLSITQNTIEDDDDLYGELSNDENGINNDDGSVYGECSDDD